MPSCEVCQLVIHAAPVVIGVPHSSQLDLAPEHTTRRHLASCDLGRRLVIQVLQYALAGANSLQQPHRSRRHAQEEQCSWLLSTRLSSSTKPIIHWRRHTRGQMSDEPCLAAGLRCWLARAHSPQLNAGAADT